MKQLNCCYKGGSSKGESGYWLGFDYDVDFIEHLKNQIPHTHREWNKDIKLWWVSEDYDELLQSLFGNFYALIHQQGVLL